MRVIDAKWKHSFSEVGKQALKTVKRTIGDVIKGKGLKTLLKRKAKQNIQQMVVAKTNIKKKSNTRYLHMKVMVRVLFYSRYDATTCNQKWTYWVHVFRNRLVYFNICSNRYWGETMQGELSKYLPGWCRTDRIQHGEQYR